MRDCRSVTLILSFSREAGEGTLRLRSYPGGRRDRATARSRKAVYGWFIYEAVRWPALYQMRARSPGARYIASAGFTSNASYQASTFVTGPSTRNLR